MIEDQNLKHFITESIFVLDESQAEPKEEPPAQKEEVVPVQPQAKVEAPKIPVAKEPEPTPQPEIHELVVLVFPMNSKDEQLLQNLLKAINKKRDDIKLINSFSELDANFKKLLSFGYHNELKAKLQVELAEYSPAEWKSKEILISKPLSSLHDNNVEKGKLWKALQQVFL
ncbi:hypothetical protein [Marinoscillum sp. MHG1-6]|uniref:hypothetical protein n=1 Tax=Marinoscillum sp. MHG1-6 TaxID=2959627 RepID=UPI002158574C|nr:hypothetical protein [Marinoscillum sp. MHG1-6]